MTRSKNTFLLHVLVSYELGSIVFPESKTPVYSSVSPLTDYNLLDVWMIEMFVIVVVVLNLVLLYTGKISSLFYFRSFCPLTCGWI